MAEQREIIETLLEEFKGHRESLLVMIEDLEKLREKVDSLFPDNMTKRSLMYFEQKIKAVTELFKALLDMRKEIAKSVKDEIEIRRKVVRGEESDIESLLNVREIAKKVEQLSIKKDKVEKTLSKDEPVLKEVANE